MLLISFIQNHYLEVSFLLYEKAELIISLLILYLSICFANIPKNKAIAFTLFILIFILPFIYVFYFQKIIVNNYLNQEIKKQNFHYGCMTYYTTVKYKPKNSKEFSYRDYFIINNTFSEVYIRGKNTPIGKQIDDFNTLINPDTCYSVRYIEFKLLFYKKIKVYDLVELPN